MSRQANIQKLITIYNSRLQKLREHEALKGLNTSPETQLEIEDIEDKLEVLKVELENADSEPLPDTSAETRSAYDVDRELARLESAEQQQARTGAVNISGIRQSATSGSNFITGNVRGDLVAGDKFMGDKVGGNKVVGAVPDQAQAIDQLKSALNIWQKEIAARIDALADLDDEEKEDLKNNVHRVTSEAEKGEAANPGKIGRWLNTLGVMAPDILEVTVKILQNPFSGIGLVLEKINDRIKLERHKTIK